MVQGVVRNRDPCHTQRDRALASKPNVLGGVCFFSQSLAVLGCETGERSTSFTFMGKDEE